MEHASFEQKHYQMAKTARFFAFIAILSALLQTVFLPFIFGGLSIIFGILSKGDTEEYSINAKLAILLSIGAIILNICMIVLSINMLKSDPTLLNEMNNMSLMLYGTTWTDAFEQFKTLLLQ